MASPLVSIIILSFNRRDQLIVSLNRIREVDYENYEIIVVDNNSSDETSSAINRLFNDIVLLELKRNIGIAGWNEGMKIAKGDFFLLLDDDSFPQKDLLKKAIINSLNKTPWDILAIRIFNNASHKFESIPSINGNIVTFIGCGVLIKREVIKNIGMFCEQLFLYDHEIEFCMRAINSGFSILEFSESYVTHNLSPINRTIKYNTDLRYLFYSTRNYIFILFLHFNLISFLLHFSRILLSGLTYGIFHLCLPTILMGIKDSIKLILINTSNRDLLDKRTQAIYKKGWYAGGYWKLNWNHIYNK